MNKPIVTLALSLFASAIFATAVTADEGLWIHPKTAPLASPLLGPFVQGEEGQVIAIDTQATYVSSDGGTTWSEPRPLIGAVEKKIRVSNERAMLRTKSGVIIAAFMNLSERNWTWDASQGDAPGAKLPTYVMRSLDNGKTWVDVQKLHEEWSGCVRDMIQTSDGRVIFTAMKMQHHPGRHAVLTYSSTDDGKTWKASNLIDLGGAGHHGGVTEPTLTALPDGRLWMLIRTNWGFFWSAYSHDGGKFWREIRPSDIPSASSPAMLRRLASGRLLLLWNRPYPEGKSEWPLSGGDNQWSETPVSNHREELSLALSDDNGKTWSKPVVVAHRRDQTKGSRWVSYPYIYEHQPGELWLTTMQGNLRIKLQEKDFVQ